MKILITGGAGFIGSHLCESLLGLGHEVVAVDNLITGRRDNIAHLEGQAGFRFIEHDVTQPLEEKGWEAIFHLASPASPVGYGQYPVETMMVNSLGTYHMLELARFCGASFFLASTSEVYGDPLEHPQSEDYWGNVNPIGPRACYDEGKRFAEALTVNYQAKFGLEIRIVRIFNTYGPRNQIDDGRVIPNFLTQAIRSEPITVYGDGLQTRSLCYVSDLVEGIIKVQSAPGARGRVINLGRPQENTVLEMARIIKGLTNSSSEIVHQESRAEEIARRRPDISLAKELLGWEPQVGLEEGLSRTIAWFRERVDVG